MKQFGTVKELGKTVEKGPNRLFETLGTVLNSLKLKGKLLFSENILNLGLDCFL